MAANLKTGFTTGACSAAAAKAACTLLHGGTVGETVDIPLPDGGRISLPISHATLMGDAATAAVVKDAGDDPDITNGMTITAEARWSGGNDLELLGGSGIGTVTKKGLSVPPGGPAINPVPRRMIREAVREVTHRPVRVILSIPGGEAVALRTFNPRLGIVGGLSILGTTGIVRPYSHPALKESLKCALDVALASGAAYPVFTAGNIGTRAARKHFTAPSDQIIEVGNEWGFMLDCARNHPIRGLLAVGHPGKLAKLADGEWDTHSSRSKNAVGFVSSTATRVLGTVPGESPTVEGIFGALAEGQRHTLARELSKLIAEAIAGRTGTMCPVAVALVDMQGNLLGHFGNMEQWQNR